MRTPLLRLAAAVAAAMPLALPATAGAQQLTCADVALRCPDLQMRAPYDLRTTKTPGGRTLLHAANAILSVGRGPVSLRGSRLARRVVYRSRMLVPGIHRIRLVALGGGRIAVDAVAVEQGPAR